MKKQDFNCSITAEVTAEEAVEAISRVSEWWAADFEGSSQKLGDIFTVRFGETFVTFRITEFIPGTKVVWSVEDCYLHWLKDKTEWTDTNVIFELSTENGSTTINFTHQGLIPAVECYSDCVKGWTEYIPGSLLKLLTVGEGQPS